MHFSLGLSIGRRKLTASNGARLYDALFRHSLALSSNSSWRMNECSAAPTQWSSLWGDIVEDKWWRNPAEESNCIMSVLRKMSEAISVMARYIPLPIVYARSIRAFNSIRKTYRVNCKMRSHCPQTICTRWLRWFHFINIYESIEE